MATTLAQPTLDAPDFHSGVNHGVPPVTYGQGSRPPRGNYAEARSDYTCEQPWAAYTEAEHALFDRLCERQLALLPGLACEEFIASVRALGMGDSGAASTGIPRFEAVNARLKPATGWEVVAVPGLIPEEAFFSLLAQRRFPVTHWLRTPEEFDYVVEPDVFHDLFGHVPLLFNPVFADYMQAYGQGALKASRLGHCELLTRLYWYTVEFGLIQTPMGLRAYGAGILSSPAELRHSVQSPLPARVAFELERVMRSRYRIDDFQATYFVIQSFDELFEATRPDFTPIYERVAALPALEADEHTPDDRRLLVSA